MKSTIFRSLVAIATSSFFILNTGLRTSCTCVQKKLNLMQEALTTMHLLQKAFNKSFIAQSNYLQEMQRRLKTTELSLEEKQNALAHLTKEKEHWLSSLAEIEKIVTFISDAEGSQANLAQEIYHKSEEIRLAQDLLFTRLINDITSTIEPC